MFLILLLFEKMEGDFKWKYLHSVSWKAARSYALNVAGLPVKPKHQHQVIKYIYQLYTDVYIIQGCIFFQSCWKNVRPSFQKCSPIIINKQSAPASNVLWIIINKQRMPKKIPVHDGLGFWKNILPYISLK